MSNPFQIVVCGGIVPDPLQTLEPVAGPAGPALKNEMMLPAVLDPWAGHALYEAAHLARKTPGSKVWLVSLGPKAKLQQVMMTVAQKAPFELVALDGPAGGLTDASRAAPLAAAIRAIAGLDKRACCCSAAGSRLRAARAPPCRWSASSWASRTSSRAWTSARARRRQLRDPGARGRRQAPGLGMRRHAGRAGLGYRQPGGAAQQSADRHGQHAQRHARAAAGQGSAGPAAGPVTSR